MKQISQHKLLVTGESFDQCRSQVENFFRKTTLVKYDCIKVRDKKSFSGLDAVFIESTEKAIQQNRQMLEGLLDELRISGCHKLEDLKRLPQGYESKTLHIISHILDGFIGIDSSFYNLIDDSHWILGRTEEELQIRPEKFWLIHVDCFSATPEEASLLHM